MNSPYRAVRFLFGLTMIVVLGSAGCVGYKLGSMLPPGIRTLHVPTFKNESGEPEIEGETTQAAIQEFQKDGTLRIVDAGQADAILTVRLKNYKADALRYDRDRSKTTREYRLKVSATLTFSSVRDKKVLLEKDVVGECTFESLGDPNAARREALPDLARDLAHEIVENVVEFW